MGNEKYKRDLEKLFSTGGDVPERFAGMVEKMRQGESEEVAAWRAEVEGLREALEEGFRPFVKHATAFVRAGHPLPDDEDLLTRLLDHPQERVYRAALTHLIDLDRRATLRRPGPIRSRLRTVRTMSDDPGTLELVSQLEERLGAT